MSSWNGRRIKSFLYLAVAFFQRRVRRLIRGRADDGGADRFLENFAGEGMAPMTLAQEALIRDTGRCIVCGLCEAVCPLPVERWATYSRATAMAREAAASIPASCPEGCRRCVEICPTGVPLADIPAFVHRGSGRTGGRSSEGLD